MVNPEERVDGKASNNKEGEEGARVDSTYHFALIVLSGVCTYDRNFFFLESVKTSWIDFMQGIFVSVSLSMWD